jgi:AGCS family alanine or glycine:cation symporter
MGSVSERLSAYISAINDPLWSYVLVFVLVGAGLWFTLRLRFVQFRYLPVMIKLLSEGAVNEKKKGVSSFEAFAISIASRVGTGNIAGVATAVALGGPGSVFWMWVIALLGMATAFVESVLAQIYKQKDGHNFVGGPAYYIEKALKQRWLGMVFAVLISVTFGFIFNMVQSNTITASLKAYGVSPLPVGLVLALLTALIIFGGVKRVAAVSGVFVPIMAIVYVLVALYIIAVNITHIPALFRLIVEDAFSGRAVAGGALGMVIMQGVKRGLFSNEAGMGSAPNAAAAAHTSHPVKQGLVQALSVFTDTMLVCSCTAFIILLGGFYTDGLKGVELTQLSVNRYIGAFGPAFIVFSIFTFAFSSIIGNYYYGESNIKFMRSSPWLLLAYRIVVILLVFCGAVAGFDLVWNLADLFMALMALVNLYAIIRLFPIARGALYDFDKQYKAGKNPEFYKETLKTLDDSAYESNAWPSVEEK